MIRIAITGPESSGKSTLAEQLASQYGAPLIKEYAREYLTGLNRKYSREDVEIIAREQLRREQMVNSPLIICDTDIIVLRIWFRHKYGEIPKWLAQTSLKDRYTHHLLTRPDLPYEPDPLRENPDMGAYFFDLFIQELENFQLDYTIVEGAGQQRLNIAKKAIDACINGLS